MTEYQQFTDIQSALIKPMWLGKGAKVEYDHFLCYNTEAQKIEVRGGLISQKLLTLIMELIINVIDHKTRFKDLVTVLDIKITVDGRVCIYNDGPGIEPKLVLTAKGESVYAPELVMLHWMAGENMKKAGTSISAGTNGMGAKLCAYHSKRFRFSTGFVSGNTLTKYTQEFTTDHKFIHGENGHILDVDVKKEIHPPVITKHSLSERITFDTTLTGMIDRVFEGFIIDTQFDMNCLKFEPEQKQQMMCNTVESLKCILAMYNIWCGGSMKFILNRQHICFTPKPIIYAAIGQPNASENSLVGLATLLHNDISYCKSMRFLAYPNEPFHYWDVLLIVHSKYETRRPSFSLVNGLIVRNGGHIDHTLSRIDTIVKYVLNTQIQSLPGYKTEIYSGFISLCMRCEIRTPTFGDQAKTALIMDKNSVCNIFTPKTEDLVEFVQKLKDVIVLYCSDTSGNKKKSGVLDHAAYRPAIKQDSNASLIITEGDSASAFVNNGIEGAKVKIGGYTHYGVFPLLGVVSNVRKTDYRAVIEKVEADGSKSVIVVQQPKRGKITASSIERALQSLGMAKPTLASTAAVATKKKPSKSEIAKQSTEAQKKKAESILTKLANAIGLEYDTSYNKTNIKQLNYGSVIIAADRDLDGVGNILGLVINWFYFYWPSLVNMGFVRVFLAPLIRATPNKPGLPMLEFGSQRAYARWVASKTPAELRLYGHAYSKGLGSDDEKIAKYMFENLHKYVYTYAPQEDMESAYDIYYGRDPNKRKTVLRTLVAELTDAEHEEMMMAHVFKSSWHTNIDVKSFQKYNIQRKLAGIDGLLMARRKMVAMFKQMGEKSKNKVATLAGKMMSDMDYLHGDSSACNVIRYAGQKYPGARTIPLVIAFSVFGSRIGTIKGIGKDAGQARYILCSGNRHIIDTLFPRIDDDLLPYTWDGTRRCEPVTYMPALPYGIMETEEIPAHGWKQSRWARNVQQVITVTQQTVLRLSGDLESIVITKTMQGISRKDAQTYANIKYLDNSKENEQILRMDTDYFGDCDIKMFNNRLVILGKYTITHNTTKTKVEINITEIPPRVGIIAYVASLKAKFKGPQIKGIIGNDIVEISRGAGIASIVDVIVKMKTTTLARLVEAFSKSTVADVGISPTPPPEEESADITSDDDEDAGSADESDSDTESVYSVGTQTAATTAAPTSEESLLSELTSLKSSHDSYKITSIDPIIKMFDMYMYVTSNLNFIMPDTAGLIGQPTSDSPAVQFTVVEYKTYWDYFVNWFNLRLAYYYLRCDRKRAIFYVRIDYYKAKIRYISAVVREGQQIRFHNKKKTEEYLIANGYPRINTQLTTSALYMRGKEIMTKIANRDTDPDADYSYVHELRHHELSEEKLIDLEKALCDVQYAYDDMNENFYKMMTDEWQSDIKKFKEAYNRGVNSDWQYEHYTNVTNSLANVVQQ